MIRNLLVAAGLLFGTVVLAGSNGAGKSYQMPSGITQKDYLSKTIIARVHPGYRNLCSTAEVNIPAVEKVLQEIQVSSVKKVFPNHLPPEQLYNAYGKKLVDLSLIYEITFSADVDLVKVINRLLRTGVFEYAEPKFIPQVFGVNPNDPLLGQQTHLNVIAALQAWNISTGDTNVVVGITDTGTDTDHPDLAPNVKINYNDPVNGADDDNDGFTDNYAGWDVGDNDNNPQVGNCGTCSHGSHVSGCASAVTNNNTGVASPGYNCKYLPIKVANASGDLVGAYEGITYAADHGCQIINCSWGGPGGSSFGQNVVDYATFNKNALVIAAAGNSNSSSEFFPAAYDHVLCVAATSNSDVKSVFSNYGSYIDVCAPGNAVLSTYFDDTYSGQSGTSMASPIVAGAAALVKSVFPGYSALQIGEQLRINADNIYNLNPGYQFQLGSGRINLLNALTLTGPSVRMEDILSVDNNDNIFLTGDTLSITGDIINYLDPTTNLTVTLTSVSPYATIIDGTTTVGVLGTLATTNNNSDPFTVKINSGLPKNAVIPFRLVFTDGSYTATQAFSITANVDYINIMNNDVLTTNTSRGRIGYNTDGQLDGKGFDFDNDGSLMYEAGLMIGRANQVSDVVRGDNGATADEDFNAVVSVQKHDPGVWSDFDTYGLFNDNGAASPLGVRVRHRTMSWTLAPFNKFHIWEYSIQNTGATSLNNLFAGIFSDWDIDATTFANNKADQDANLKMGYVWCTNANGYYAGIKLLTQGLWNHYAIDNVGTGSGGVNLSDGYSSPEKFTTLSTPRATAGGTGAGNDVIDVVSSGPFQIAPNDSVVVAFALIIGNELSDLQNSAQQAQIKYDLVTSITENSPELVISSPYPNPVNDFVTIPLYLKSSMNLTVEVMDVTGRLVLQRELGTRNLGLQEIQLNLEQLTEGNYFYRIRGDKGEAGGKLQKL
jgi:subtilisin family serine protease